MASSLTFQQSASLYPWQRPISQQPPVSVSIPVTSCRNNEVVGVKRGREQRKGVSKHRKGEEVPIYNSCQRNYHQRCGIWNELLIVSWKLYVKTCSWGSWWTGREVRGHGGNGRSHKTVCRVFSGKVMEINSLYGKHWVYCWIKGTWYTAVEEVVREV